MVWPSTPAAGDRKENELTRHQQVRLRRPAALLAHAGWAFLAVVAFRPGLAVGFVPRIVNGHETATYPTTGAMLLYQDATQTVLSGICTGTLIGCQTFVTAAHCVCRTSALDAQSCRRGGLVDPATVLVFFQHAGFFPVESATINPAFEFAVRADLGVLTLARPVTGIHASPLNTLDKPAGGVRGTIVGFGTQGGSRANDVGIKRQGSMTTAACTDDLPEATLLCWQFTGSEANICDGDSGGPVFIDMGDGPRLAAVSSGGSDRSCEAPDLPFATDIFVNRDWLASVAGSDLGRTACADAMQEDEMATVIAAETGTLTASAPEARLPVDVPEGAAALRVALNGQLSSGDPPLRVAVDFDLALDLPDGTTTACRTNSTPFEFCEVAAPAPGRWEAAIRRVRGDAPFQVTASILLAPATGEECGGDCNGDGSVTVDEVVVGVNIALGNVAMSACPSADSDHDGNVTVDEVVGAVTHALAGCAS
jgi:hypothetical protein